MSEYISMEYDGAAFSYHQFVKALSEGQFVNMLKSFRSRNMDPNCINSAGYTPLMYLCISGKFGALRQFVAAYKNDLNINAQNNLGETALLLLCKNTTQGWEDVARMLISLGADYTIPTITGQTVFDVCKPDVATTVANITIAKDSYINLNDAGGSDFGI